MTPDRNGQLAAGLSLPDPVLAAEQVGAILGIPASGVRHLHQENRLPGFVLAKRLRWMRSEVVAYIERCRAGKDVPLDAVKL